MTDPGSERLREVLHECAPPPDQVDPLLAQRARQEALRLRHHRRIRYGVATIVAVSVVAASPLMAHFGAKPASEPAGPTYQLFDNCPVTAPVRQAQVPPALRDLEGGWVGADRLWIQPPEGAVAPGETRLKFGVFTLDEGGRMSDADGTPSIAAHRLDAAGSAVGDRPYYSSASGPHDSVIHFWPTTITLPAPGCWAVSVKSGTTTVLFVVPVGGVATASESSTP